MSPAAIAGIVVLGVIVVATFPVILAKLAFRGIKEPLARRIGTRYRSNDIVRQDLQASCFGLESVGIWQIRGDGGLILTPDSLTFFMLTPDREIRVPLESITELTLTKRHLKKATMYDLLKVRFVNDEKPDSVAWHVANPGSWIASIEQQMAKRPTRTPT